MFRSPPLLPPSDSSSKLSPRACVAQDGGRAPRAALRREPNFVQDQYSTGSAKAESSHYIVLYPSEESRDALAYHVVRGVKRST